MSADKHDEFGRNKWFQRIGIILAVIFYIVSVVMVIRNHGGMSLVLSPDTKVLTFAHWQLEDGFREGFDEAIKIYEKAKAEQGVKVKVRQVAVPVRGYTQWSLTQLIGGEPADVMELSGSSDIHNQYFVPLSPYIGLKNPWNKGTPLEKMSWRESFADDMLSALDVSYSEFFSVCLFMHTTRVYVNMKLYQEACGTDKLPSTLTEWINSCKKMREYGIKHERPIIPIGVRGFDKGTLNQLFSNYNSQMNADLSDTGSKRGYGVTTAEIFRQINTGELDKDKLLAPVELITEIGQYFADGFPAIDLEQTKYLFFSGNVGYFIDGTYNAWSMVNNSPFPVKIIPMPLLTKEHPLGGKAFGAISELGSGIQGKFGITRKSKNFDLALDFLQFITSWKINQLTMVEHCRWMSSLKRVQYEGLMKDFEAVENTSYTSVPVVFNTGTYANRKVLQWLEGTIIAQPANSRAQFWDSFIKSRGMVIDELVESSDGIRRNLFSMDGTRSALTLAQMAPQFRKAEKELFLMRSNINLEGTVSRLRALEDNTSLIDELGKLEEYTANGN